MKKLYLSQTDKKIAGIFGGLGERYEVDSTVLRVIAILLTIIAHIFPVVIVYLIAWIVIPKEKTIHF
ncbi:PspC domain-containing protein [Candidatus Wolfebacteria bacterium]|nr:MAG: PspC domain-containing protein [Candidatus Wolfebacteria bacterium]